MISSLPKPPHTRDVSGGLSVTASGDFALKRVPQFEVRSTQFHFIKKITKCQHVQGYKLSSGNTEKAPSK